MKKKKDFEKLPTKKQMREFIAKFNDFTLRDEANAITAYAFRNGFIEDLHAGKHSKILEKEEYSRITQEEMKKLMIESSAKVEEILLLKEKRPLEYKAFIRGYNKIYCSKWDRHKRSYKIKK